MRDRTKLSQVVPREVQIGYQEKKIKLLIESCQALEQLPREVLRQCLMMPLEDKV